MSRDRSNFYRLNVLLPLELGDRLSDFSVMSGMTKVAIVTAALDSYLTSQLAARKLIERLSDPEVMASVVSTLGPEFFDKLAAQSGDSVPLPEGDGK